MLIGWLGEGGGWLGEGTVMGLGRGPPNPCLQPPRAKRCPDLTCHCGDSSGSGVGFVTDPGGNRLCT